MSFLISLFIQGGYLRSQITVSCEIQLWIILSSVLVKQKNFPSTLMLDRALKLSNWLTALRLVQNPLTNSSFIGWWIQNKLNFVKILQWKFWCSDKWTPVSITKIEREVKLGQCKKSIVYVPVLGSVDTIYSYGYTDGLFLVAWYVVLD